jgi:hypothetical protein
MEHKNKRANRAKNAKMISFANVLILFWVTISIRVKTKHTII